MKFTKKELPLVLHGVVAVTLFCLLLASIVIFMNRSVAWFSYNKEVTSSGAAVTLKDLGVEATYYVKDAKGTRTDIVQEGDWRHIFQDLVPGDTVTIGATYTSTDQAAHALQVSFKAFEEVPLTKTVNVNGADQTNYYYFGSQLQVTQKTINGGTPTELTNQFLVTPPTNQIYHTAQATPNEITLTAAEDGFQVPAEGSCTLEFTVQFVNLPTVDQNDYQGFGKETVGGTCWWQLVAAVAES